jgi:hypothetical protein
MRTELKQRNFMQSDREGNERKKGNGDGGWTNRNNILSSGSGL